MKCGPPCHNLSITGRRHGMQTAHCPEPTTCLWREHWTHPYITLLQDNIDPQCSTPWEREGFSETDSTQYCNSKKHLNWEEAQLLATPPMYQIQQIGSIKDYSRNTITKHKLKTRKENIQKDGTRRDTEVKENHTTVEELHWTSHLWTLYLKLKLNHSSLKILNWEYT